MRYVVRPRVRGSGILRFNFKGDHGMALSEPAGYTSSDLVFEENFSGTALDNYWHTYTTSNAANGWPWNTAVEPSTTSFRLSLPSLLLSANVYGRWK